MPRFAIRLITALLCLLVLSARPAGPAFAQDQDHPWQGVLQKSTTDLDMLAQEFAQLDRQFPQTVRQARQAKQELDKKFGQLKLVASLSNHNPYELKAALAAVGKLSRQADSALGPLSSLSQDVKRIDARLIAIERDFTKLAADNQDPELAPVIGYYQKYLGGMRPQLDRSAKLLAAELAPATALQTELGETSARISANIPTVWRDFYLTPQASALSVNAWRHTASQLDVRLRNLATLNSLIGGEDGALVVEILIKTAALAAVLAGLWLAAKRRFKLRPPVADMREIRSVAILSGLGLGLAAAASSAPLLLYDLLSGLAEILFARAAAAACWLDFRRIEGLAGLKNPLAPLTNLFAVALLIHILDAPAPCDALAFIAACLVTFRVAGKTESLLPWPLRPLAPFTRIFCAALALASLTGWLNLAILVMSGVYLAILAVVAGHCLSARLRALETTLEARHGSIARLWFARALGYPAVYLGLFMTGLYWFCARLGGRGVFVDLLSRQADAGYASLSLWRLFFLLAGFHAARASVAAANALSERLADRAPNDQGTSDMIRAGATYVLWGLYALLCLRLLGVDMASLAMVIGGLSVGIGFGLQNVVNNFIAGLILLFGRSIQTGDVIQLGETTGTVKKVNIRNTIIQTGDNATLFVPNSELIGKQMLNWTHKDPRLKKEIVLRAAYGADAELIREIMLEAAAGQQHALKHPNPKVFFQNFGESALEFSLAVWIDNVGNARSTLSAIRDEIYRKGQEAGVPWTPPAPPPVVVETQAQAAPAKDESACAPQAAGGDNAAGGES